MAHSRSPRMHEAAYAELAIDAVYQSLPVPPELFAETVRALPASGFVGINVTIPHKQAAAELADRRSAAVEAIGAANTLTFRGGVTVADNTDATGLIEAIARPVSGLRALVLGAGGTARAAVWALTGAGAEVLVHNRTPERATQLTHQLGGSVAAQTDGGGGYDLIVNTTAVGMEPESGRDEALAALGISFEEVDPAALIVDFVYRDGGSPLTLAARDAGLTVVDGLELLVRQGAASFEIWFERPAPLAAMRAAVAS